jgi:methionyl-tRNA formyltransferase
MKFSKIDKLIMFGGSYLMAELIKQKIAKKLDLELVVFSSERHLDEQIGSTTLKKIFKKNKIKFYNSDDINKDPNLKSEVTPRTIGIALGAAWTFDKKIVNYFSKNHLLDLMGLDLPRYRGGAHYTWQILHQNLKGVTNMQIILGGAKTLHYGKVIDRIEYNLPENLTKPIDYFNFIMIKEADFLVKFLTKLNNGDNFKLVKLDESKSAYYPFLSTEFNGLINWNWPSRDIYLFINAFDEPYKGASTYLNDYKVYLKDSELLPSSDKYHPFTSGIVVRKDKSGIYVALQGSIIKIKKVMDAKGKNFINKIELGDRLYTPMIELDKAAQFSASYSAKGLK